MTDATTAHPPERHDRPKVPHWKFLRELTLADGRKLTLDRRSVAMLCEGDPNKFNGRKITIIGLRIPAAAPVPVQEAYDDLKNWWRGDGAKKRSLLTSAARKRATSSGPTS